MTNREYARMLSRMSRADRLIMRKHRPILRPQNDAERELRLAVAGLRLPPMDTTVTLRFQLAEKRT